MCEFCSRLLFLQLEVWREDFGFTVDDVEDESPAER